MATEDRDKDCDNTVSCSVCLEPYDDEGRRPCYLLCLHSFCTPCVSQLAQRAKAQAAQEPGGKSYGADGEGEGAEKQTTPLSPPVSIPCPTCRTPTPLPLGGASQLKTNIYTTGDRANQNDPPPVLCDLCEGGAEAKHTCSTCLACYCPRCRRAHDRLCKPPAMPDLHVPAFSSFGKSISSSDLLEMVETAVKKLTGEEKKRVTGDNKEDQALPNSLVSQGTQQEGLESPAQGGQPNLVPRTPAMSADGGMIQGYSAIDRLTERLGQTERLVEVMQTQNTLMCRDLASVHDRNSQLHVDVTRLRSDLTLLRVDYNKARQDATSLQRDNVSLRDKTEIVCQENQQLRNDLNQLRATHAITVTDVSTIRTDVTKLQTDVTQLHTDLASQATAQTDIKSTQTKLQTDMAQFQTGQHDHQNILTEIQTNQSKLQQVQSQRQKDFTKLKTDVGNLQKNHSSLQNDLTDLQKKQTELQTDRSTLQKDLTDLQTRQTQSQTNHSTLQKDLTALEAMQKQLQAGQTQMKKDQDKHLKDQGKLQSKVGALKKTQTEALQKYTSLGLVQASVKKDSDVLGVLDKKISKLSLPVAFCARHRHHKEQYVKTLVCDQVECTVGGGYDSSSGVFTAPVSGTYIFTGTCNTSLATDAVVLFDLLHGDQKVQRFLDLKGKVSSTGHAVVRVQAGQNVSMCATFVLNRIPANSFSCFTGFLLVADV